MSGARALAAAALVCLVLVECTAQNTRQATDIEPRLRRQSHPKRPGFFGLLFQLITETQNDTRQAFNQIGDVLNVIFRDDTATVSRQELLRILRRNFRGLSRLFNRELDMAIKDSNRNAVRARKEFQASLRPFLSAANITVVSTTTRRPLVRGVVADNQV